MLTSIVNGVKVGVYPVYPQMACEKRLNIMDTNWFVGLGVLCQHMIVQIGIKNQIYLPTAAQ